MEALCVCGGQVENLCRERALQAYRLDPEKWGINVQPYRSVPPATSMHDP